MTRVRGTPISKINNLKKDKALALRQQGFSYLQISKELDVSDRTIRRWLQQNKDVIHITHSIPPSTQAHYSLSDKAENRLRILFNRGQNTKKECLRYLASLHPTADTKQLNRLLLSCTNKLKAQGVEWEYMPEGVCLLSHPEQDILPLLDIMDNIKQSLHALQQADGIDNKKYQAQLSCLCSMLGIKESNIQGIDSSILSLQQAAKRRMWNVPVAHKQFTPTPSSVITDLDIPY